MGYYKDYECCECDCALVEGKTHIMLEIENSKLKIINVPMGRCDKCHEEYIHGEVNEEIRKIFRDIESTKPNENRIINFEDYKV